MKVHGKSKRRTWRKFHIGIDAETQDIICCELTGNNKGDAEMAEQMLEKLPGRVKSARGDGAYDASKFRKKDHEKGGICIVPPPRGAAYKGTDELMKVLERSRRYKEWIVKLPPDADLLKEYFKAIGQKSFIETLPGKILRFTICNGLSIAAGCALPIVEASITGLCLNACDSFLLDKLVTGWKPYQYIEGDVQKLLTPAI